MRVKLWDIPPVNMRDGDRLCGNNGVPFATIDGSPWVEHGSAWVTTTDGLRVEFPHGTTATVER